MWLSFQHIDDQWFSTSCCISFKKRNKYLWLYWNQQWVLCRRCQYSIWNDIEFWRSIEYQTFDSIQIKKSLSLFKDLLLWKRFSLNEIILRNSVDSKWERIYVFRIRRRSTWCEEILSSTFRKLSSRFGFQKVIVKRSSIQFSQSFRWWKRKKRKEERESWAFIDVDFLIISQMIMKISSRSMNWSMKTRMIWVWNRIDMWCRDASLLLWRSQIVLLSYEAAMNALQSAAFLWDCKWISAECAAFLWSCNTALVKTFFYCRIVIESTRICRQIILESFC